jgi:hypothetical protein
MKLGRNVLWCLATLAVGSTLAVLPLPSVAQDRSRGHSQRDWDGNRDHSSRDRNWERRHNRHPGDMLTDYPDYSTWHINGGLYSVSQYNADRGSSQPWRRQRAAFFGHASVNLGGHNYARVTINRNGRQYYSFKFGGG